MKKFMLLAAAAAAVLVTACTWDDTIAFNCATMGNMVSATSVKTDAGDIFEITEKTCEDGIESLDRVYIRMDILKDLGGKKYEIRLLNYAGVLVKDAVKKSGLPSPDDGLGDDPVMVTSAWMSGGYLNIGFEVYLVDTEKPHTMNLVLDDSVADKLCFTLRHNDGAPAPADGYEKYDTGSAWASFPISALIPSGSSEIPVELHWTWDKEYSDTGVAKNEIK